MLYREMHTTHIWKVESNFSPILTAKMRELAKEPGSIFSPTKIVRVCSHFQSKLALPFLGGTLQSGGSGGGVFMLGGCLYLGFHI